MLAPLQQLRLFLATFVFVISGFYVHGQDVALYYDDPVMMPSLSTFERPLKESDTSGKTYPNAINTPVSIGNETASDSLNLKKKPQKISLYGYYRLFLYGRNMTEPYPNLEPFDRAYGVGDGYREPMLSLNVVARPNGRASFGTELFFFTPYLGTGPVDNVFQVNLGINFYGNFRTSAGNFGVRAGGIHWYNLSPFTIGVFQQLDRFSIFDRTPWEGVNNTDKYEGYYNLGSVNVGDLRWNYQAFQGIILNGNKLPLDFSFDLFYGKMQLNGGLPGSQNVPNETIQNPGNAGNVPTYIGFAGTRRSLPSFITGGRLAKTFGPKKHLLAYSGIYSQESLDSIGTANRNFQVHTLSLSFNIDKFVLTGELGAGSYASPTYERKWGEALMLRLLVPKDYTFLPLDIQVYQISEDFFNPNGEIITNGNAAIQQDLGRDGFPAGVTAVGSPLTLTNQLAHNRRGININTKYDLGPVKLSLGWGMSGELSVQNEFVSYTHRVNGLALSRIYQPFPENATTPTIFGPYGRKISFFRGALGVTPTTDLDPETAQPLTRKYHNSIDITAKYKTALAKKPLYFFYIGALQSAKDELTGIPTITDNTYVFAQYHELDIYYELFNNFVLTGYLGAEFIRAGTNTLWGETGLPADQVGLGFGAGFDWMFAKSAGLYFRYRRMNFDDRSFELDKYKGNEVTIEVKTFF